MTEEYWQWNVRIRSSIFERMKDLAKHNHTSMPKITEAAFEKYLEEATYELYTNEDQITAELNSIKERLDRLEKRKR